MPTPDTKARSPVRARTGSCCRASDRLRVRLQPKSSDSDSAYTSGRHRARSTSVSRVHQPRRPHMKDATPGIESEPTLDKDDLVDEALDRERPTVCTVSSAE